MQRAGSTAGTRQRMGVQDALWLEMDRPTNLMVVDSLFWTTEPIDWDRFTEVVRERLWDRYRVFRSIAVHDHDGWHWEERPGEALESHITHVRLAEPGDGRVLRELVASQRTVPLDRDRPLWQVVCIDGFGDGSAVLSRTHHAIADGIRMVQLAMSLFDATPDGGAILPPPAPPCTANPTAGSLADRARSQLAAVAGDVAGEVAHLAGQVAGAAAGAVGHAVTHPLGTARSGLDAVARAAGGAVAGAAALTTASVTNPVGAAHGTAVSTSAWLQRALRPTASGEGPIVDLLAAGPGDLDIARKLLLGTLNDPTIWTGRVGTRKEVAWSEPLPLDEVKAVARAHDATVNDVLVTCVAGTLHHYLTRHDAQCASVNWMI
ncbi:MAG: wax ester/triacylglycerol synthase domain-containing protein, partial [Acidimicrobiia bacterium]